VSTTGLDLLAQNLAADGGRRLLLVGRTGG
jgi:hypothetical protein